MVLIPSGRLKVIVSVSNSWKVLEKPEMLANDDKPRLKFVPPIVKTVRDGGAIYLCTRFDVATPWADALSKAGAKVKNPIHWIKNNFSKGDLLGDKGNAAEIVLFIRQIVKHEQELSTQSGKFGKIGRNLSHFHAMQINVNHCRIELLRADITEQEVDAIVNAANASLAGGGGVDGAIHRRGGPSIIRETDEKYPEGCPTGSAVASGAGNLTAKYVFHAVGPRWRDGKYDEPERLRSAYRACLELAVKHDCHSIAFPSISTGIYGFPIRQAAPIALQTVIDFLKERESKLELVRFCLFSDADLDVYSKAIQG